MFISSVRILYIHQKIGKASHKCSLILSLNRVEVLFQEKALVSGDGEETPQSVSVILFTF